MSEEFGNDVITISDDEGNDFVLEHIDTLEFEDTFYMAFLPTDIDEDDDEFGILILQVAEEDGEEVLTTIEDERVLENIYNLFMERFLEEGEEEED